MYIYSLPLDGGECQLIKKHGKFIPSLLILQPFSTFFPHTDLKNIDQPSVQTQQQQQQQQATLVVRPSETIPIPNTSSSTED